VSKTESQRTLAVHRLARILLVMVVAGGAACVASPARYVKTNADLGAITAVAVLPFENVTNDKLCAERVHKIFITELLAYDAFRIVEPGQVLRAVRRDQLDPAALTPEEMKRLGEQLKVQALFLGQVLEYDEGRGGGTAPSPRVRLQFRLVDTETGTTLWSVSRTRGGATIAARMFGVGGDPASSLAQALIRDELAQLTR
jgi:TolB-like protein